MATFLLYVLIFHLYMLCGVICSGHFLIEKYKDKTSARLLLVLGWPIILVLALIAIPYLYITKGNVENW